MTAKLQDPCRARALFEDAGTSVAEWARLQGFSTGLVYQVLEGRRKCLRGQSHKIAVALGLKQGATIGMDELSSRLKAGASAPESQEGNRNP